MNHYKITIQDKYKTPHNITTKEGSQNIKKTFGT